MSGTFGFLSKAPLPWFGKTLGHCVEPRQELDHVLDFVRVDGVAHARIDPLGHYGAKGAEHVARFVHARERNVPVDIAAAEKHRRAAKRSWIGARRAGRTDQAGRQTRNRTVAPGM